MNIDNMSISCTSKQRFTEKVWPGFCFKKFPKQTVLKLVIIIACQQ